MAFAIFAVIVVIGATLSAHMKHKGYQSGVSDDIALVQVGQTGVGKWQAVDKTDDRILAQKTDK